MANLIQIKRSTTAAAPTSLANGELAFTSNGNVLYIGSENSILAIGGLRTPGVLSANQALVTNSTSWMDSIKVANLNVTQLYANGAQGADGKVLTSDNTGTVFWADAATLAVGPQYVTNTDSRTLSGNLYFTGTNTYFDYVKGDSGSLNSLTVQGQTTLNGNVVLGDAIQDKVTLNGSLDGTIIPTVDNSYNVGSPGAIYNTGYFTQLRLGSTSGAYVTASGNTVSVNALDVNTSIVANTATIYHDLFVGGDVHITGNAVYSNVESYIVNDPLIQLAANNNNSDTLDIGFFGNYGIGGGNHRHTGLFRDASDGIYKLFTGLEPTPTTFVDTANSTYTQATLQAYLNSGALISNSTSVSITGTSGVAVSITANTLSLTTALPATSGGTGQNTYTTGDLLYASSSSALSKLSTGGASNYGYVLQVNNSGVPTWDTLDGGTF